MFKRFPKEIESKGDYLFLSSLVPEDEFKKIMRLDKIPQMATHLFYWKFYRALRVSELSECNIHVISTPPLTEYPTCRIKIVKRKIWKTNEGNLHQLFFFNFPVIKTFTVLLSSLFEGFRWCISVKNKKAVIVYSTVPYLITGYLISTIYNIPLVGIMTDPPNMHYRISSDSAIKSSFRRLNGYISNILLRRFSGVIALTKGLVEKYSPGKKHLIVEGIVDLNSYGSKQSQSQKADGFVLLYAGSLSRVYGILEVIKAVNKLPFADIEFWIFGKGDIENEILSYAKKDKRIKYFGFVENEKVKEFQKRATLLINPRPTDLPDSNFSFPSKILEYMQSGTPTLLTRLPGIPEEYNNFVFYFNGFDENSFCEKIREIYFMDRKYLIDRGQDAKAFAETKNIKSQGNKIGGFILDVVSNYNAR